MANDYYQAGDQRAAKVQELFGRIAPRYDLINDLQSFGLHRHWKRVLVRLASVRHGDKALDVCCGTGDIAKGLAAAGAEVAGLDFCQRMLDFSGSPGEENSKPRPNPNPVYLRGDAMSLPFSNDAFDIVSVGYGLRNLSSWERGLDEMVRVAKPGGRVLVLDFGKPDNALWRSIYFAYLRLFVPVLGLLLCGSAAAYSYILESLKHYPAQRGVEAHMRKLGLANVRTVTFLGGVMAINVGHKA